jgi:hypothetical protein
MAAGRVRLPPPAQCTPAEGVPETPAEGVMTAETARHKAGPTWVQRATVSVIAVLIFAAPALAQAGADNLFGR